MRPLVAALLLAIPLGCAHVLGGGAPTDAIQNVSTSVDSTLRIAATQLKHHGYSVQPVGDRSLVTMPRPIPEWLGGKDAKMKGRQWFVQVNSESHFLARGSRLEVIGYLVPESSTLANNTSAPTAQNAVLVKPTDALYQEVRTIATWIGDAARRGK